MKRPKMNKKKNRSAMLALLGIGIFLVLGVACFVLGYGLKDGWDSVGAWFTSKYASILYAGIAIYAIVLCGYLINKHLKGALE